MSEVSRARNYVATIAAPEVRRKGGLVLWLDADMVISPHTVLLQAEIVAQTGKNISGRYVTRKDPSRIAASHIDPAFFYLDRCGGPIKISKPVKIGNESYIIELTRCMTGMGCLMMTADAFLDQFESSYSSFRTENNKEIEEKLVCCPQIVEDPNHHGGYQMMSEDFTYCLSTIDGVWMAKVFIKADSYNFLDYGHIAEKTLMHEPNKESVFRDDR